MRRELKIGDLLVSRNTGKPGLIMAIKESRKNEYGSSTRKRKVYRVFDDGREYWRHDIEVRAKFVINP